MVYAQPGMRCKNFSGILRYKRKTYSRLEDQIKWSSPPTQPAELWTLSSQQTTKLNWKKNETEDKYLDLARELKKLWNMKVTVILIVIDAPSTVTKRLLKGLEELEIRVRVVIIQATALLRSARILRLKETLSLRLQWKTISWRWCGYISKK